MIVTIKQTLIAFGLLLAVTFPAFAQSGNPVLPGFHADPEILYSNKTKKYYIYSTTDGQPGWLVFYCFFVCRLEELEGRRSDAGFKVRPSALGGW